MTCKPGDLPEKDDVFGRGVPERVHDGGRFASPVLALTGRLLMEDVLE